RLGKFDRAIPHLLEAARLAPANAEVHSELGSALATKGNLDEAIIQFQEALRYRPDNPLTHYFLAKALVAQGTVAEAAPHYREALRLRPDFTQAREALEALGVQVVPGAKSE
ncbi:MAG: hypothetical protein DME25_04700, partial [Verrucomicrobia bacterium]